MRICICSPFKKCKDCDSRYLLMVETAERTNEHYYCYGTYDELNAAFEEVEKHNYYCGCKYAPHTAVKLIPRDSKEDAK